MNWAETMKGNATVASLAHATIDGVAFRPTHPKSWDPFEVWLTRIKQPRDRAANSALAGTSNGGADRRDQSGGGR